jgi:hypothetical protein
MRTLEIFEIVHDLGAGPVLWADELAADFSLTIDDVGFRRTGGAEGQIALLGFVVNGEQIDVIVDEVLAVSVDIVIEIDTENDELRHLLLEIDERGELFEAGSAPGSPEVENYYFAAVIVETDRLCAISDREVWSLFGYLCGVGTAVASGCCQKKDESHAGSQNQAGRIGSQLSIHSGHSGATHISIIRSGFAWSVLGPDGDCSGKK